MVLKQLIPCDLVLALASAGKSIAAKIAMMAMTTRSSIKVNPLECLGDWRISRFNLGASFFVVIASLRASIFGLRSMTESVSAPEAKVNCRLLVLLAFAKQSPHLGTATGARAVPGSQR